MNTATNRLRMFAGLFVILMVCSTGVAHAQSNTPAKSPSAKVAHKSHMPSDADIATAVKENCSKDCGCGECAAKGCKPCHGKNCYYCVAKGLTTKECGCGKCAAKGCDECGPGCDVCKFHLGPVAHAKAAKRK